jgi:hypothetical protein
MIGTYERIAQRLLVGQPRPKPFCQFRDGHCFTGTQSLHRTRQSRKWRLFWKIKSVRQKP